MKKILSVVVLTMLLFAALVLPTSAAGEGKISMSSASAKRGETVTLNVTMPSNPGLVTMTIKVTYDTSVLELVGVTDSNLLVGSQLNTTYGSPYTISWVDGSATSNNTKTGTIATFKFKVKSNAPIGASKVTLQFVDSFDTNYNENTFTATSGKVTVACSNHTYGGYTNANGSNHTRTCSACGYVETKSHTWNSGTVTKTATCKEKGVKTYTCTACNTTKTESIAKTTNHTYGSWTTTKEATCTAKGTQERTCSTCQKVETRSVAALGHKLGSSTVIEEATCTKAGKKSAVCSVCKETVKEAIAAKGHKYGEAVVTKEATETETGLQQRTCSICNDVKEEVIPKITAETTTTTTPATTTTTTADADKSTTASSNTTTATADGSGNADDSNGIIWIIVGAVAAIVVIGIVIAVVKKKK